MEVYCLKCATEFDPANVQFGSVWDGELEFRYFECPVCHNKTLYLITDPELREGIEMYRDLCEKVAARMHSHELFSWTLEARRSRTRDENERRRRSLLERYAIHFDEIGGEST